MSQDELMTLDAAAKRLDISIKTMRRLIGQRALPFVRIGQRMLRVKSSDLEEFIKSHTIVSVKRIGSRRGSLS